MEGLEITKLSVYKDNRGWLGEIIRADETNLKPLMAYLSMTNPGAVRGPHEHREQTDLFCLIGNFRLYFWDNRKNSPTYRENKTLEISDDPTVAVIPPGIVHAYKNIGSSDGFVINLPDRLYRGWGKADAVDEIRYENDLSSPFRIEE
ncbi:MAG: dTDP-4-dehydrorhamnose 3,5-epimerase family protein [Thermodesulfovibrionia bacterium]